MDTQIFQLINPGLITVSEEELQRWVLAVANKMHLTHQQPIILQYHRQLLFEGVVDPVEVECYKLLVSDLTILKLTNPR